jgi:hypothetical protein
MKTYVVYDQKSGKIVHAHRASEEAQHKPEDILRLVHSSLDRSQLGILEFRSVEMRAGESYRVNPKTKKLERTKSGAGSSGSVSQSKAGQTQ